MHNKVFDESCLKAVFRAYEIAYPDYEFECTLLRSLKAHAETPEFKKYVAEIEVCGQMKLERFEF